MIDDGFMCASLEMATGLPEMQPVKAGDQPGMEAPVCSLGVPGWRGGYGRSHRDGAVSLSPHFHCFMW